jgi:hypothetical protein
MDPPPKKKLLFFQDMGEDEEGEKEIKVEEGEGGVDDPLFQKI